MVLEGRRGVRGSVFELGRIYWKEAAIAAGAGHGCSRRRPHVAAWRRFGKGNHPAGLNFGDCFAYALAESTGESLLFKGRDFALTDIEAA